MKNQGLSSLLLGGAVVVLAASPVFAQAAQVTNVELRQGSQGLEVFLQTEGGDKPQVFTVSRGNDLVADVINTQLRLPSGNVFRQDNPGPGIASVTVSQLDANSVRLVVSGTNTPPAGEIVGREGGGLLFSFTSGGGASASAPPPPPGLPALDGAIAQAPSNPNVMVPNPQITINGQPVTTPPITNIPAASGPSAPPPFLPRAVAPPLGDIAISTIDTSPGRIELGSSERVRQLVVKDAPVREVLATLARLANLNVAFTADNIGQQTQPGQAPAPTDPTALAGDQGPRISLDIVDEPVENVFNYILQLSGLQANRIGRTIFVGSTLPVDARNVSTLTLRLNQANAETAAGFLSAQGAETQRVVEQIQITSVGEGAAARTVESRTIQVQPLAATLGQGPLLLRGLSVLADPRLNSITLVGDPRKIQIATSFLSQLDLRRRQVAVNVKVVDVNLAANDNFNSSFSFGIGDSFFVNDGGAAALNFGNVNPPLRSSVVGNDQVRPFLNPPITPNPIDPDDNEVFFDPRGTTGVPLTAPNGGTGVFLDPRPPVGTSPTDLGVQDYTVGTDTTAGSATFSVFPFIRYPRRFLSLLQAQIVNNNAKILTDPTLVVQEGQEATVKLTQEVIGNIQRQTDVSDGLSTVTVTAEKAEAGLTLNINVQRIDDNGFVTLQVTPVVTALTGQAELEGNVIALLTERSLQSGFVRLRDGQTLILSGIIQEQDRVRASKVPILGDLPIIGSLFRSTTRDNQRAEVIIVLTPQILDDSDRSTSGYGYTPGAEVRPILQQQMFPGGTSQ